MIFGKFLGKYDDFEISKSKNYFFGEKKITPTKKSLEIDRTPNLDTPRYRVYCLTPPELGDTVPIFFRIWSAPGAGPLRDEMKAVTTNPQSLNSPNGSHVGQKIVWHDGIVL